MKSDKEEGKVREKENIQEPKKGYVSKGSYCFHKWVPTAFFQETKVFPTGAIMRRRQRKGSGQDWADGQAEAI